MLTDQQIALLARAFPAPPAGMHSALRVARIVAEAGGQLNEYALAVRADLPAPTVRAVVDHHDHLVQSGHDVRLAVWLLDELGLSPPRRGPVVDRLADVRKALANCEGVATVEEALEHAGLTRVRIAAD